MLFRSITDLWGIAAGYGKRLNKLGIESVEDLAKAPLSLLREHFGVMGEQFHNLANGIDESDIREKYIPETTSFSIGQALYRDFTSKEIPVILREMSDSLCARLHKENVVTDVVHLAIMYSLSCKSPGFSHQIKLNIPSDNNDIIFKNISAMYQKYVQDLPIRRTYISFGHLTQRDKVQLSLFDETYNNEEDRTKQITIEKIQSKYGKDKLYRATALLDESTFIDRSKQIGGHRK